MDDLSRFCCLNSECPDHGKRDAANPTVTGRYGPEKSRRMLRCRTCKTRFSERKGTPLYDARLPPEKFESVLDMSLRDAASDRPAGSAGWPLLPSPATAASSESTPGPLMTNSWRFPPRTTEVEFDEKWSFVATKEANCDRDDLADDHNGDDWDHVAFDPKHKLVVAVVPGARTVENTEALVEDFRRRTGGRLMDLMTSDDYPAYESAILHAYGATVTPPRAGKPGRPKVPYKAPPPGLTYATVTKRRQKVRVVEGGTRVVFGMVAAVLLALGISRVSRAIQPAFVERENGTDRHRNAREGRRTYRLSKDWRYHEAVTFLSLYIYNFCWPVRTLASRDEGGRWVRRSPASTRGVRIT